MNMRKPDFPVSSICIEIFGAKSFYQECFNLNVEDVDRDPELIKQLFE